MTELMRRRRALMAQGGGRLPAAYQEVEWIGCSGTQYINTGVTSMTGVVSDLIFSYPNISSTAKADSYVIGAFGTYYGTFFGKIGDKTYVGLSDTKYLSHSLSYYQNKNTAHIEWGLRETSLEIGGQSTSYTRTSDPTISTLCFPLGTGATGKIYRGSIRIFEIINSGTANQHFVPCYRKSDGVIGMYDIANGLFYENAGTGTFTKGADVA